MKAAFPPAPPVHIGKPTAHTTRWLYVTFTAEAYPQTRPANPGTHPNYTNADTVAEREVKKLNWELANKRHRDTITMSACRIERLLECFEMPFQQAFENQLIANPNMEVQRAFQCSSRTMDSPTNTIVKITKSK